jgi:hypothetical protein
MSSYVVFSLFLGSYDVFNRLILIFLGSYDVFNRLMPCGLGRRIIARARVFVKGARTEKLLAHPP